MSFADRLRTVQKKTGSLLCVGLDVTPEQLPTHLRGRKNGLLEFTEEIISATHDLVCSYKPNLAFYEALGDDGWKILRQTLKLIPKGILTIGDGKRGDIGNTAQRYAHALYDDLGFDAVTVNPYMGFDSVEPFLQGERGVFLLALTSNPGSADFQRLLTGKHPLYETVVKKALKWNGQKNIGFVVGATHASELKRVRSIAKDVPLLIPGVGKQGGDLESVVKFGCTKQNDLAVINASRSVLYASSGKDFAVKARAEAHVLRDAMNTIRNN